jgi:hypothetical protein
VRSATAALKHFQRFKPGYTHRTRGLTLSSVKCDRKDRQQDDQDANALQKAHDYHLLVE